MNKEAIFRNCSIPCAKSERFSAANVTIGGNVGTIGSPNGTIGTPNGVNSNIMINTSNLFIYYYFMCIFQCFYYEGCQKSS